MTARYPIVFESEESGAVSAYVPGLPVYAAATTADKAERAVRDLLALYVEDLRERGLGLPGVQADVKVAKVTTVRGRSTVSVVGPAALLGRHRSMKKAAAARRNGKRGGRPAAARRSR